MALKAITTVYSYRPPEIRRAIDKVVKSGFPHHVLMGGVLPPGALDNYGAQVAQRLIDFHRASVPALGEFANRYPTSGTEPGIQEVMSQIQAEAIQQRGAFLRKMAQTGQVDKAEAQGLLETVQKWDGTQPEAVGHIYMLKGEYEGYRDVAAQRCLATVEVEAETDFASLEPGYFFISNPSAREGKIIPNELIRNICDAGHKVFYDLAYLDSTRAHEFDVSHPNIFALVLSFSKPYGLFYDRIGFTFSRQPIDSLFGTKWFKNIFALMIANSVVTELKPGELYAKYRAIQESIIAEINEENGLNLKPSDAFLLAHITAEEAATLPEEQQATIARFKRGDLYRFCLTPYYMERDPERKQLVYEWRSHIAQEAGVLTGEQMRELIRLDEEVY